MPTLNWIGKEAVVNHHLTVPFRLLKDVPELSCGDPGSGNLIVEGDNLVALKALLPYYAGQVKCIYIDPPYNTGNEGWAYNDNVNSPLIRQWIGETVGKEGETLDRHDRWLCMMYPRLALLREFLREDGAIFVSIDDNESARLRLMMDEIFGQRNFVSDNIWLSRVSPANDAKYFSSDHENVFVYAKSKADWNRNKIPRTEEQLKNYKNPDNDPRGPWNSVTYTCNKSADERPNLYHAITNPTTGEKIFPKKTAVWKYDPERHKRNEEEGLIWWGVDGKAKMPRLKRFLSDMEGVVPRSFFHYSDVGHTQESRTELLELVPGTDFITPKPTRLIQRILQISTGSDCLILDSFAGSGTTAHAVLKQNAEDGGRRRFILVEMDERIASEITAERVSRAVDGYTNSKGKTLVPLGGGFRYCQLGEPLFDETGEIRKSVTFGELARHVWFTETGEPLPKQRVERTPFLGDYRGTGIFLLYNGILEDKSPGGGNILTRAILAELPPFDGPRVIYCAGCRIGPERLRKEGIIVRQTPYEIKIS